MHGPCPREPRTSTDKYGSPVFNCHALRSVSSARPNLSRFYHYFCIYLIQSHTCQFTITNKEPSSSALGVHTLRRPVNYSRLSSHNSTFSEQKRPAFPISLYITFIRLVFESAIRSLDLSGSLLCAFHSKAIFHFHPTVLDSFTIPSAVLAVAVNLLPDCSSLVT